MKTHYIIILIIFFAGAVGFWGGYQQIKEAPRNDVTTTHTIESANAPTSQDTPRLPPGFYLEKDTVNKRFRWCETSPLPLHKNHCTLIDHETREKAIRFAWDIFKDRQEQAAAKWEKVKP